MKIYHHTTLSLSYKFGIMRAGKIVYETPFKDHMITDAGLNAYGGGSYSSICHALAACIIGTGVAVAVRRDPTGGITFTQSGTTITASGSFFIASDTGRLFKWGTGSAGVEGYLTYISGTSATFSVSQTVAVGTVGTVWYVNTASLVTPIAGLTWTKQSTGNSSSFSASGSVFTCVDTTINISSALASPATITEIAINNNTTNSNVYDRDIVSPNVAMLAGDQAVVTIVQTRRYSPITPLAVANFATGYNSAGDLQLESAGAASGVGISTFNTNGTINAATGIILEPFQGVSATDFQAFVGSTFSFSAFNATTTVTRASGVSCTTSTLLAYGTGIFYREIDFGFSISAANGVIHGFGLGRYSSGSGMLGYKLTTTFTKLGTQVLTIRLRKSFSRVLTN